jgi:hypothetical protein
LRRIATLAPLSLILVAAAAFTGCAPEEEVYYNDIKAVLDTKCVGCHTTGDIAPFPLETYEQVVEARAAIDRAIRSGTMPPWSAADGCNEYTNDRSLSAEQQQTVLDWIADDLPEGDPEIAIAPPPRPDSSFDVELILPEPYTPRIEPDDQRCFLVPWEETESVFVTGFEVVPDARSIVHHVIAFFAEADDREVYDRLDANDPGPGYTCYGGPGTNTAEWLAAWAPGGRNNQMPEGTGIEIPPGAVIILQMHYNTDSADPTPDQSTIRLRLTDSVERPAVTMPFTQFEWVTGTTPMTIPAGESDVVHSMRWNPHNYLAGYYGDTLGIERGDSVSVHSTALHMHDLGTSGTISIDHGSSETCLVEVEDYDFQWQNQYRFTQEMELAADDQLFLECHWDNTAENQPIVDGERRDPRTVVWGDGTSSEMCLGVAFITARP